MNRNRIIVVVIVVCLGIAFIWSKASQSSAKNTTCQQFAAMSSTTGLFSSPNSQQTKVIDNLLSANKKSTGSRNEQLAYTLILSHCNIYQGHANSNPDDKLQELFSD